MATMMKEKPRAKKKSKEKRVADTEITTNVLSTVNLPISEEKDVSTEASITQDELKDTSLPSTSFSQEQSVSSVIQTAQKDISLHSSESSILVNPLTAESRKIENKIVNQEVNEISSQNQTIGHAQGAYKDVCHRLDIISFKDVPVNPEIPFDELENKLEASSIYISQATDHIQSNEAENIVVPSAVVENMVPSAPIFEENLVMEIASESQESLQEVRPVQLQCMPLEVAMHICGGKEMAEIREMSEREEAIAEAGMALSPEHPLVDLLSTYRCSAIALEQENQKILKGYSDEEKSRSELWKIEKRTVCESVKCNTCAQSVSYKGTYDYATLLKEKLPAAQLRLEGLLKDAQESYCHHQHQALLAYYQIEEFISEVVQGGTGDIREALTLVLQELRASGATTCLLKMEYFIDSLKRWARALCGALLKKSDPRQLLFLLHQLSRQSHSVRWAAPLIRIPMCDGSDAARAMAILDLMLAAPVLEAAKECTEENEEMWEEVDRHGDAGAVSEGALRERDLLALLRAFPLRALVARLVLLQRSVSYRYPAESEEMWEEVDRHGDAGAVSEGALRERDLLALLRAFPLRALVARLVLLLRSVSYRYPAESEEMWEEVDRHGDAGAVSEGALRERDLLALLRAFPLRALVARLVLLQRSVSYRYPAESEEMWEEVDRHGDAGAVSEGALRERDLLALLRAFPLRALVARLVLLQRSVSYRYPAESEEMWEEVDRHGDAGAVSEGALRERDLLALLRAFPLRALVARLVLLLRSVSYRYPAESEEMWEEVDRHGDAGAVSEGALRERDLLALLRAFPLRALVARLVLLLRSDITQTRPYEWEQHARDVLRACCGVRALLATLTRAACAHPYYSRLRAELRALGAHAMHAVADLHRHNRDSYPKDLEVQIEGELEAIFRAGWGLGGGAAAPAQPPPAALLRPAVRSAYCVALMTHIHEKPPLVIACISLQLPPLGCGACVRAAARAADCDCDAADTLAMVADFLVQVALKPKKLCNGECIEAARECLPRLLVKHDYLFTRAVHSIAYVHQLEPLQPSADVLKPFCLHMWRPSAGEIRAVLDDWSQRSPKLLQYLLQALSYTPYTGLSLESQLAVGSWLCALPAPAPDWAWNILTRLRVHRSSWRMPLDAPAPERPEGVFAEAHAVLASSWGHSLPVICEHGVSALSRVAAARAPVAAHALPLVMTAMMDSPESVALTPQFASLLSLLLAPAQSLVQWARGERASAPELLLRRILAHVENQPSPAARDAAVSTWLHGLYHAGLSGTKLAACDAVLLATRHTYTLQEAPKPEVVSHLVRNAQHAPLSCAAALYAAHAQRELSTQLFPRLLVALATQRAKGQKIHVDNALKQIGSSIGSEELVIYQTAAALLAPAGQPSLPLWRLLMHLYLHSSNISSDPAPIGPCFFAGLIKSRTLAQLKKRLHDTILYHHNQADTFKTLLNTRTEPKSPSRENKSASPESVVPRTSIADLTGETSHESDTESGEETDDVSESEERRRVNVNMLAYHEAAEKMLREYDCFLETGERLRATPVHADIARFIPDAALNTAWAEQLNCIRPAPSNEDDDLRAPKEPTAPDPPLTALQSAVTRIMRIRDRSERRSQLPVITSPVGDVSFSSQRQLYTLVHKHLADLKTFARQWCADVNHVAALDNKLWPLVRSLRYRKALAPVRKLCPNKCGTVVLSLENHYEWPISENAARGIAENRSSAKVALRELLRARPQEAKTVAALHTIARRISGRSEAVSAALCAWNCARDVGNCGAAHAALVALVDRLADRWICSDSRAVLSLMPVWCASASMAGQQALCRALVARVAAGAGAERPRLYVALLQTVCVPGLREPQRAFSYLSQFDLSRCVDDTSRGLVLEELGKAAQCWGREPDPDLNILLELIGVHLASLTTAPHLPAVSLAAARAAAAGRVPPAHVAHVARAAACAGQVPFDKLGHLLRDLGSVWWHARSVLKATRATYHVLYAEHVAALQHTLLRAFVAQGKALSYAPERVSLNAWSALQESWGAWVSPHPELAPLLPSTGEEPMYTTMVKLFMDNIHQMMLDCPGCEERLLSLVWEWAIQIYLNVSNTPGALDSRIQISELLAELGALPWSEHQWPRAACLPAALQISQTNDLEMQTWLAATLRGAEAATWLRDGQDCDAAPRLAALLQLFAGPLPLRTETLEQAAHLPWQRLPEVALDQALERFFVEHHNPLHPYHDTPQFRVVLAASALAPALAGARARRACAVSRWTRAAAAPALLAHVPAHAAEMLSLLAAQEPYVEEGSDELEELVGRAAVIMCMEPAAAEALPVWEKWIASASPRLLRACVSAARGLTTFEYFAAVADAAAAALMAAGGTWAEVARRLSGCAWPRPRPLLEGGRLHAAYALALTAPVELLDLSAVTSFVEKEVIISVWICAMCRAALGDDVVQLDVARAQLAKLGEPPRLALLRALTGAAEPSYKHRLLCRLALCIITPNSEVLISSLAQAHQACPGVLVSQLDLVFWARAPSIKHLPKLAVALFPGAENYFAEEVRITSGT